MLKSKAKETHCRTYNCREIGTRKSSLLMLNFFEVFAGRAMVTDAGRAISFNCKLKAALLQKMNELPERSFTGKPFQDFSRKKAHF